MHRNEGFDFGLILCFTVYTDRVREAFLKGFHC